MSTALKIVEIARFETGPYQCSYLPHETAQLEYRVIRDISADSYGQLLSRGWRRFGCDFFRPACRACVKCRSLRVIVDRFRPSRSQLRALARNQQIEVVIQPPTVTNEHVALYNIYHHDMQRRRGWRFEPISKQGYEYSFVRGGHEFAREFSYLDRGRLVGVGLADVVPAGLSSVYFFHEPQWRPAGPGVFSILQQWMYARRLGLAHQYLGYWIADCQSMAYKSQYRPHEILVECCRDDERPIWLPGHV
jgi:leucyl-tRNA---protein transferase